MTKPKEKILIKRRCLKCQKVFRCGSRARQKFCGDLCQHRYNSKRYFERVKDTPEYKEKRKIYFNKWLSKNRAHFTELIKKNYHKRHPNAKYIPQRSPQGKFRIKNKAVEAEGASK